MKRAAVLLATTLAAISAPAEARASNDVRVAVVYNLLRFTEFASDSPNLVLCVEANDPLATALTRLSGRQIAAQRLQVVLVQRITSGTAPCRVIYAGESRSVPPAGPDQITIGEGMDFVKRGGTFGLVDFGDQLRFAVNLRAARNSRVVLRAQMLRLAANIVN